MYAKEMRQNSVRRDFHDEGGGGDRKKDVSLPEESQTSAEDRDDFALAYGNYGNPYSFAPYQLALLLIDFIMNWTMDLTHEFPLAVLVIFIFQSLAIIINLILYIMASASQAMQVGLQRRVTVHHWLNLFICLGYISLTGWWFIWALRKSWPSVSDQFSFTWPATDLEEINRSTSAPSPSNIIPTGIGMAKLQNDNTTKPSPSQSQVKEHYSLWSPGFNALYVVHRTVAILYYFIYLRATFLVLNTPAMNKFVERKKSLVERFEEAKKNALNPNSYDDDSNRDQRSRSSNTRRRITSSKSFPLPSSSPTLGLDEYLFDKARSEGFFLESEGKKKKSRDGKGDKRQILWADDSGGGDRHEPRIRNNYESESAVEPKPKKRHDKKDGKRSKKREVRRHKEMAEEDEQEIEGGGDQENIDEDGNKIEEVRPIKRKDLENRSVDAIKEKPPKPQPRERTAKKKSQRETSEDDDEGGG